MIPKHKSIKAGSFEEVLMLLKEEQIMLKQLPVSDIIPDFILIIRDLEILKF